MSLDDYVRASHHRVRDGAYAPHGKALRPHGSLREALDGWARILAELKPRAPSAGRLLRGPPEAVLEAYRQAGAAGISVLTDSDHFDGGPDLLREAHAQGLPTMLKDFVVDEAQIDCAAHCGASAVLLIERILAPDVRDTLIQAARDRGLEVLLEIHATDDLDAAMGTEADMLGVNARDLDTLELDLAAARARIAEVADAGRHVVALSGILDRSDRLAAEAAGARGCLVGTSLMRQRDPELALAALRRPLAKACGITDERGLDAAAGADLAGFVVHAPTSPRELSDDQAVALARAARRAGHRPVLVTKRATEEVATLARTAGAAYVQASSFDVGVAAALDEAGIGTLPVVAPGGRLPSGPFDGIVVDTPSAQGGGSGQTHDWTVSARTVGAVRGRMSLIAGGLDAGSAPAAIAASGAWGADASSGLESRPGSKDPEAVRAFVEAVHAA